MRWIQPAWRSVEDLPPNTGPHSAIPGRRRTDGLSARRLTWVFSAEAAIGLVCLVGLFFVPEDYASPLATTLLLLPVALITQLGRLGSTRTGAMVASWAMLALALLFTSGISVLLTAALVVLDQRMMGSWHLLWSAFFLPMLLGPALGAGVLWWRRRGPGAKPALEAPAPHVFTVTIGMVLSCTLSVALLAPLLLTNRALLAHPQLLERILAKMTTHGQLLSTLMELPMLVAMIFICAGWLVPRSLGETARRLGLSSVNRRTLLRAALLTVVFALPVAAAGQWLISQVWSAWNWPQTDMRSLARLLQPMMTPLGIILLSIWAGSIEELAIRGLLQPRIGIFASSLLFTSLHALQYHLDALAFVFVLSLGFGWLRRRTNTLVAIVVHSLYDLVVLTAFVLGLG